MKTKLLVSGFFVFIFSVQAGAAENALDPSKMPPWAQPGIIKLAVAIDLHQEQIPVFRAETGDFIESFYSMVKKELRRNSVGKKRTIERRTRKLTKKLDKTMISVLDEDQMSAYESYRDALVISLSTPRKQRAEIQSSAEVVQHE